MFKMMGFQLVCVSIPDCSIEMKSIEFPHIEFSPESINIIIPELSQNHSWVANNVDYGSGYRNSSYSLTYSKCLCTNNM
jgi:hypothetical protein